ncbi:MAG: hypothetical protein LBQ27_02460, partial [Clostridiales bacterium]|nr:hypothetical protein [Clostridiales bacterium]
VSVAPTPAREKTWEQAQKCNGLIKEYCDAESYLHFIDCTDALLNGDKSLKREIYKGDNLHFNEKGYEIWKSVIAPILTSEL